MATFIVEKLGNDRLEDIHHKFQQLPHTQEKEKHNAEFPKRPSQSIPKQPTGTNIESSLDRIWFLLHHDASLFSNIQQPPRHHYAPPHYPPMQRLNDTHVIEFTFPDFNGEAECEPDALLDWFVNVENVSTTQ